MLQRFASPAIRGAADLTGRRRKGVGAGGDFCATNCPVDGEGRIHHRCGPAGPQYVQVFTTFVDLGSAGSPTDTGVVTYTVPVEEFCPMFFALPDNSAIFSGANVALNTIVEDIQGPDGSSLLIGTNPVMGEFFSSLNDRGNRIAGCCVRAGLSLTVTLRWTGGVGRDSVQGSFWGVIK